MSQRPLGITALAVLSVMVGIYSFMGAMALLLGGSIGTFAGSDIGPLMMVVGSAFLGLTVAAYLVGGGFWMQRSWAWAGGLVVFVALIVANLALSLLATNLLSAAIPIVGAVIAIWYLYRPATKAQLLGPETSEVEADQADQADLAHPEATATPKIA